MANLLEMTEEYRKYQEVAIIVIGQEWLISLEAHYDHNSGDDRQLHVVEVCHDSGANIYVGRGIHWDLPVVKTETFDNPAEAWQRYVELCHERLSH